MKAAELRKSILQMAVQGTLVPQDLHDEPASALLERIRAEKAQFVKEGRIKKEKLLPAITEDEVPYDLPEGWIWCRLGNLAFVTKLAGFEYTKYIELNQMGDIPVIRAQNVRKACIDKTSLLFIDEATSKLLERSALTKKCLLITFIGAGIGDVAIFNEESRYHLAPNVAKAELNNYHSQSLLEEYFLYYLLSPSGQFQLFKHRKATAQPSLSMETIRDAFIPIPPLAEQQRIVTKVDKLMTMCDDLEAAEKEQEKLESDFIEYLPKSILQAAVQGKLVPQNLHDEPASELLKRIRTEKAQLIKGGKIKKEKPLPPIVEDEIPYDLPDGWVWCRLGNVIQLAENNNIHSTLSADTMINYVDIDAIDNNAYRIKAPKYLPVSKLSSRARRVLTRGSIVYSLVRPYLDNIAVVMDEQPNYIGSTGFAVFKPLIIDTHFIISVLLSPYIREHFLSLLSGFNSPSVSQTDFLATLFPLPPLAEQQRIVTKVDELMILCDELKAAKNISLTTMTPKIIPFPAQENNNNEDIRIAARGDVQGLSDEAMRDIDELFGDDAHD